MLFRCACPPFFLQKRRMGQRNVHTYRVQSFGGAVCLIISYIPCVIAFGIIACCVYPYNTLFCFEVLWPASHTSRWMFCYCFLVGNFQFSLLLLAFFRCIMTPAGFPDHHTWSLPPAMPGCEPSSSNHNRVFQLSRGGELRSCSVCGIYKPDDAHHCSSCGKCILRMDHHCPWINNCVGRDTEKFFVLFLLYIPLCGIHISATIFVYYYSWGFGGVDLSTSLVLSLIGFISLIVAVVLFAFGTFHLWMIWNGQTTIDVAAAKSGAARAAKPTNRSHFDEIFGDDRRLWVMALPIAPRRTRLFAEIV